MDEEQIIEKATYLFLRYGIKSMTMDEIARQLSISKKTLYKYVSDKNELVTRSMSLLIKHDQECLGKFDLIDGNAIDKMVAINDQVSEKLENLQPAVIYDLRTYYHDAWDIMEKHKSVFVLNQVKQNMIEGIKEGYYRENLDPELNSKIYVTLMDSMFRTELFGLKQYSYQKVHTEIAKYHLRGIASEKGLEYIKKLFNKIDYK
jgi:AcrR family transcriptional regulator